MNNVFKIYSGVPITDNLLSQIDKNISRLVLYYELSDDDINHSKLAEFLRLHPTIEFYVSSYWFQHPFYVLSDFPKNLEKYTQSFILVEEILHYINHDGHIDKINVLDFTQSNEDWLSSLRGCLNLLTILSKMTQQKKLSFLIFCNYSMKSLTTL